MMSVIRDARMPEATSAPTIEPAEVPATRGEGVAGVLEHRDRPDMPDAQDPAAFEDEIRGER